MKAILVLVGGGDRDEVICQTALAAARPIGGRLEFLHIHVSAAEAARYGRTEFAVGDALSSMLDGLVKDAQSYSTLAAEHVRDFCARAGVRMCDTPGAADNVTACFREETDNALERLIYCGRMADLVVIGRSRQTQGLSPDTLERLVLECGRPLLVAASTAPRQLTGTVMVCWKDCANSARAVSAAAPLLAKASRVVVTSVVERDAEHAPGANDLARRLAWHGCSTEVKLIAADGQPIPDLLAAAAGEIGADLVISGAYGSSAARKFFFGSCTEAFIQHADRPILLMH